MSSCWTLSLLLLCAWTAETGHLDPGDDEQTPGSALRLTRGAREDAARDAAGRALDPERLGLNPGTRRVSRGTTKGAWRDHSTLDPDRYSAPPPLNASLAALLPLGGAWMGGASKWAYVALLLALVVFSAGLVGNLALMCLVWNSLHLQGAWHCVLAGLALWDFLVLFLCLPLVLMHELTGTRLMAALSCSLVPFLQVSSMGVATFSLCALSIDRFHSATSPAPASSHVEPCTSILPKISVVFVGSILLATPELLLYRSVTLPLEVTRGHYSSQVDVCLAEPSPELPLAVLSLVLTYQEARSWWLFGCYLCLPLLFTLSCDLVTRRVMSQHATQLIGPQESSSRSSSPFVVKKEVGLDRSPALSVSQQEVSSGTSCLNRKQLEQEAGLRSVVLALIGLYTLCTLPEAVCAVAVTYLPALPVGVAPALRLIGQFLLFVRCSATPLVALAFSRALGRTFVRCCCCCCCDQCGATPTPSPATPSTLLAPPLRVTPAEAQRRAFGTPC
ncbi:G-protein coupled receptor 37-like 1 [Eucyclogobius newberryi]|uniref:G-protein coupled receptor 37-like 1 n=1 Tax=Eucyclogobius newberryi TaxID=166745 RepID=UPI003B5C22DA